MGPPFVAGCPMSKNPVQPPAGLRRGYSVAQVAATRRLGSRNTIYKLIASGKLRSYLAGSSRIIDGDQAIDDCVALLVKDAQAEPINPEVSKRKAAAGRKGRRAQLEGAA